MSARQDVADRARQICAQYKNDVLLPELHEEDSEKHAESIVLHARIIKQLQREFAVNINTARAGLVAILRERRKIDKASEKI